MAAVMSSWSTSGVVRGHHVYKDVRTSWPALHLAKDCSYPNSMTTTTTIDHAVSVSIGSMTPVSSEPLLVPSSLQK